MGALRTSYVWSHFTKVEDGRHGRAECRHCDATFSLKGSTGNLKRHLKVKHPELDELGTSFSAEEDPLRSRSPIASDTDIIITAIEDSGVASYISVIDPGSNSKKMRKKTGTSNLIQFQKQDSTSISSINSPVSSSHKDLNSSIVVSGRSSQSLSTSKFVDVRPVTVITANDIDMQLLKMMCKNYLHFSLVEDENFSKFVKYLNSSYSLPSKKSVSNSLLDNGYEECLKGVLNNLEAAQAVALSCESWLNKNGNYCFTVTAHFINSETERCSNFLGFCEFEKGHTVSNIAEWLDNLVKEFKINEKICAVVTKDTELKEAVGLLKFVHFPCFAHSLNLMVQKAMDNSLTELLEKVKVIVQFFTKNTTALSKLLELQTKLNIEPVKLKLGAQTHWNSTYDMLQRVLTNKNAIMSALFVLESELSVSTSEWELIDCSVEILKTFHEVTEEMSSEKVVPLSKIPVLAKIMEKRVKSFQTKSSSPVITKLLAELLDGLSKCFGDIEGLEVVSQAVFLDPRFKKPGFRDDSKFNSAYQSIIGKLKASGVETLEPETDTSIVTPRFSLWEEFDDDVVKLRAVSDPSAASITEVDMYLGEPLLSRVHNPLVWWETRKTAYPNLYSLMLKTLSVPATSVPCERLFSKSGQMSNEIRSCNTSKKLGKILFLNSNL